MTKKTARGLPVVVEGRTKGGQLVETDFGVILRALLTYCRVPERGPVVSSTTTSTSTTTTATTTVTPPSTSIKTPVTGRPVGRSQITICAPQPTNISAPTAVRRALNYGVDVILARLSKYRKTFLKCFLF